MNTILNYKEFLETCDWVFESIEKAYTKELSDEEVKFLIDAFKRLLFKLKIYVEE